MSAMALHKPERKRTVSTGMFGFQSPYILTLRIDFLVWQVLRINRP
jgi:hypothetical protein